MTDRKKKMLSFLWIIEVLTFTVLVVVMFSNLTSKFR